MRRILGTTMAAALIVSLGAPAYAAEVTLRDKAGDVSEGRVDSPGGYVYQSDVREGDVVRTTFRHGPRNIVVTSTFRALDGVGEYHGYYLRLQTARKLFREVDLEAGPGDWRGRTTVTRGDGKRISCGVTHLINYATNTVRVVVPRTCLGKPKVVRATAANAWTRPDTEDPSQADYVEIDNPHNSYTEANTWTRWLKRG
jgi:hypothetical protein